MKMHSNIFIFLIGALCIHYQVLAQDTYTAELMVESNVTLHAQTVLSALNAGSSFSVTDSRGATYTVTIVSSEMVAECIIIGAQSNCSCSTGYRWSNDVCYNYNCCSPASCIHNVSNITPLCVPAVNVTINGSVQSSTALNSAAVVTAFQQLNALVYVNVTGPRTEASLNIMDFEARVNVKLNSSKFQDILNGLRTTLSATIYVDTKGMVTIDAPQTQVCYQSTPELQCTFEEPTGSAGWNLTTVNSRFELNNGSVVQLNNLCATEKYQSCIAVKLVKVTGIWKGTFECGFTVGTIRHTARAPLDVALLPDVITMTASPLTADCTSQAPTITLIASISASDGIYNVSWTYNGGSSPISTSQNSKDLFYRTSHPIDCSGVTETLVYFNITFTNSIGQIKSARLDVPVIKAGAAFCQNDTVNGEMWPKTPAGGTVINQTCPPGMVGFKSRTCAGSAWQPVFSKCISEQLNKVSNAADYFLAGLGATQEVAKDIFQGLKNSSTSTLNAEADIASVDASINILNVMARASAQTELQEDLFPDFVSAASNMLNGTWTEVNDTVRYAMSSNYLTSVDSLVKHIKVNQSNGMNSTNLDLKFCQRSDCNVSVFNIGVNMNKTNGILKAVAVKNLMDKLNNTFRNVPSQRTSLILSATLENNSDSTIQIKLDFPSGKTNPVSPHCVFWNTVRNDWSDDGCNVSISDDNHTVCECSHLTAFSVLMSKNDIADPVLDIISTVGLAVSTCCLVIFLIIESLVWSAVVKTNLSHFRHTAIVNIATFLLLGNCCFLASEKPDTLSGGLCLTLTICKHLFYLAMFCWMLCLSVMLVHQLIFVFSPLRKRVFMFLSSILGYLCPIVIVGGTYIFCKYRNLKYYNEKTCWLVFERLLVGSMHAFLLPVGTIVLANLFSMVVVMVTLVKTSVPDSSKADDKNAAKSILKVVLFLTPVFGVTWIFGFLQLMLGESDPMFTTVTYIFTIFNAFQGLFILITGCFGEQKVREELLKIIMGKSKGNDSTKKFTSTTNTKGN